MTTPSFPPARDLLGELPTIEILDIGAAAEGNERYEPLLRQNLANVTGFEPNPQALRKLQLMNRPRRRYLPYFIGKGGTATFHMTLWPGCSSLYEPNPRIIELFTSIGTKPLEGNFWVTETAIVQTTRLDDIPRLPPSDLLKADVQGAELDVLQGAANLLASILVIDVEVEFVQLYKNQPLFCDIQSFLRDKGFVLHKFIDIAGRPFRPFCIASNPKEPMSQLLWADAIFVRDFSQLDKWQPDQLLKGAAILYECYRSNDLAWLLLAEHDRRLHGKLAPTFGEASSRVTPFPRIFMNLRTDR